MGSQAWNSGFPLLGRDSPFAVKVARDMASAANRNNDIHDSIATLYMHMGHGHLVIVRGLTTKVMSATPFLRSSLRKYYIRFMINDQV
jgi:hypothetical protein